MLEDNLFQSQLRELDLTDTDEHLSSRKDNSDDTDPFERSQLLVIPKVTVTQPMQSSQAEHSPKIMGSQNTSGSSTSTSSSNADYTRDRPVSDSPEPQSDVVLFIKMALHPMTLEDYIWGQGNSGLQHCFHTPVCVSILLAILDGVQYIHEEGIIHRDLKPSNIFLSIRRGPAMDSERFIDITNCQECGAFPADIHTYISPHIGDFGLAAEVKSDEPALSDGENAQVNNPQRPIPLRPTSLSGCDSFNA